MRRRHLLAAAALAATAFFTTPAQATLTLVTSTTGNACTGKGGINSCFATQSGVVKTQTEDSSPLIARLENGGSIDVSTLFPTIDGSEFTTNYDSTTNTLSFTYTPGDGDPTIHYIGLFQADTYDLFYDPNGITSGTFSLNDYFANNPGWSHLDFFDTGGTRAVPEPATWAMMILGFGAVGFSLRRRRKATASQFA